MAIWWVRAPAWRAIGLAQLCALGITLVWSSLAAAAAAGPAPIRLGLIEAMSGPFASGGAVVKSNLDIVISAINQSGGVHLPDGDRKLELSVFDSGNSPEQALLGLSQMADSGVDIILQGNGSAVAAALVDAVERHNQRNPDQPMVFLNYSADDPALTNQHCSFWHFRFDANTDMRMNVLTDVLKDDRTVKGVFLIDQDYVFGHDVAASARHFIGQKRPDIEVLGELYHPIGRVRDFTPYVSRIAASHADAVITGNWGPDLSLLVKAAREAGISARFYTFYGDSLGAPREIGAAGIDRVLAVSEWNANSSAAALAAARAYRSHFQDAALSYQFLRIEVMIRMLADAITRAGSSNARSIATALEGANFSNGFYAARMRASDHQIEEPLVVAKMVAIAPGDDAIDQEGSGFGFVPVRRFSAAETSLPGSCNMQR